MMARLLLIASLVGFRGASGLASASDPESRKVTAPTMSRDEFGRAFFTQGSVPIYTHSAGPPPGEQKWKLVLETGATDELLQRIQQELHPTAQHTHPDKGEIPFVEGDLTEDELRALLDRYPGSVKFAELDSYSRKITEHIDSYDGPTERRAYPWGIQSINADVVRGRGVGVNVYVLDTGIRTTHVSFGGRAFAGVDVATTGNMTVCASGSTTCAGDNNGHGTHCAGVVGATTYGVADGVTLWAMKVLDDAGYGWDSWTILAEQWVLSSGLRPAVLSVSIGGPINSLAEKASVDALVAAGVTVVVAAGNQNLDACNYNPAFIPSAITVGSYGGEWGSSSDMSDFSNYGSCIDVWAPGSYILSTYHLSDNSLATGSGTSMACPHVSGLAAIMYEAYPSAGSLTASARWDLLAATNRTGWVTGLPTTPASVNLVALAPTLSPTPSPTLAAATPSPTPAATALGVSATGDPHLQNVYGERFDLMKPGKHVLINIPRGETSQASLLRVQATAQGLGGRCADMYFQELNITGAWAEASAHKLGGLRYLATDVGGQPAHWVHFGPVQLKVAHGRTLHGVNYLNLYVKNLARAGHDVGGLLGEDDHSEEETPPESCAHRLQWSI